MPARSTKNKFKRQQLGMNICDSSYDISKAFGFGKTLQYERSGAVVGADIANDTAGRQACAEVAHLLALITLICYHQAKPWRQL